MESSADAGFPSASVSRDVIADRYRAVRETTERLCAPRWGWKSTRCGYFPSSAKAVTGLAHTASYFLAGTWSFWPAWC